MESLNLRGTRQLKKRYSTKKLKLINLKEKYKKSVSNMPCNKHKNEDGEVENLESYENKNSKENKEIIVSNNNKENKHRKESKESKENNIVNSKDKSKENKPCPIIKTDENMNDVRKIHSHEVKSAADKLTPNCKEFTINFFKNQEVEDNSIYPKISSIISKLTTIRIVFIILILVLVFNIFVVELFTDKSYAVEFELDVLETYLKTGQVDYFKKILHNFIERKEMFNTTDNKEVIEFGFVNYKKMCSFNLCNEEHEIKEYHYSTDNTTNYTIVYHDDHLAHEIRHYDKLLFKSRDQVLYAILNFFPEHKYIYIFHLCSYIFSFLMLFVFSLYTLFDISKYIIKPINTVYKKIIDLTVNIENLYIKEEKDKIILENQELNKKDGNLKDSKDKDNEDQIYQEFSLLEQSIKKFSIEIVRLTGYKTFSYLISKLFKPNKLSEKNPYLKYKSVIMVIRLSFFEDLVIKDKNYINIISKIIEIIDLTIFEHFGVVIQQNKDEILVTWEENRELEGNFLNKTLHSLNVFDSNKSNFGFKNNGNEEIEVLNEELLLQNLDEVASGGSSLESNTSSEGLNELHEIREEIKQLYHSYEMSSEESQIGPNHEDINLLQKIKNNCFNINTIHNLALLSAIKIIFRIIYNPLLFEMFSEQAKKNPSFNPINISIKQGHIKQMIVNTENFLTTTYLGKDLAMTYAMNVINNKIILISIA